jgi:hypothetical protein
MNVCMTVALKNWRCGGARQCLLAAGNNDCTPLEAIPNHYHKAYRDWLEAERIFKSLMLKKDEGKSPYSCYGAKQGSGSDSSKLVQAPDARPSRPESRPARPDSSVSSVSNTSCEG